MENVVEFFADLLEVSLLIECIQLIVVKLINDVLWLMRREEEVEIEFGLVSVSVFLGYGALIFEFSKWEVFHLVDD